MQSVIINSAMKRAALALLPLALNALAAGCLENRAGIDMGSGTVKPADDEYTLSDVATAASRKVALTDAELSGDYRATDVSNLLLV